MDAATIAAGRSIEELRANYRGPDSVPRGHVTTLMLRGVPRFFTLQQLLEELGAVVEPTAYNLVHLPWDHRRGGNITLGFVNFVDAEKALRGFFALSGRAWTSAPHEHACSVVRARVQGLKDNLSHCLRRTGHSDNPPVVFRNGRAISLQETIAEVFAPVACIDGAPACVPVGRRPASTIEWVGQGARADVVMAAAAMWPERPSPPACTGSAQRGEARAVRGNIAGCGRCGPEPDDIPMPRRWSLGGEACSGTPRRA